MECRQPVLQVTKYFLENEVCPTLKYEFHTHNINNKNGHFNISLPFGGIHCLLHRCRINKKIGMRTTQAYHTNYRYHEYLQTHFSTVTLRINDTCKHVFLLFFSSYHRWVQLPPLHHQNVAYSSQKQT